MVLRFTSRLNFVDTFIWRFSVSCEETGGCLAAEYWTNRKECILHSFLNVPIMASQTDDGVNLMLLSECFFPKYH